MTGEIQRTIQCCLLPSVCTSIKPEHSVMFGLPTSGNLWISGFQKSIQIPLKYRMPYGWLYYSFIEPDQPDPCPNWLLKWQLLPMTSPPQSLQACLSAPAVSGYPARCHSEKVCDITLLGTDITHPKGTFEDDFPFPVEGCVSFLEGKLSCPQFLPRLKKGTTFKCPTQVPTLLVHSGKLT